MSNTQMAFLGAIVGAIVISSVADSMVQRKAADLDPLTRERIWERMTRGIWWWRIPDGLGFSLIVLGVLKALGILTKLGLVVGGQAWGIPAMAVGLSLVCLSSAFRTCQSARYYSQEAPGSPASRTAGFAAVLVTAVEIMLAVGVCWVVFSPKGLANQPLATQNTPAKTEGPGPAAMAEWVTEEQGTALLSGKSRDYFRALAHWDGFRTRTSADGTLLYYADDIIKKKEAGLPSEEDLKKILQPQSEPPQTEPQAPADPKPEGGEPLNE